MHRSRGTTLIELMVVIAIIAFLSSIVLAAIQVARQKAQNAAKNAVVGQMVDALNIYYTATGYYPPSTNNSQLTTGDLCLQYNGTLPSQTCSGGGTGVTLNDTGGLLIDDTASVLLAAAGGGGGNAGNTTGGGSNCKNSTGQYCLASDYSGSGAFFGGFSGNRAISALTAGNSPTDWTNMQQYMKLPIPNRDSLSTSQGDFGGIGYMCLAYSGNYTNCTSYDLEWFVNGNDLTCAGGIAYPGPSNNTWCVYASDITAYNTWYYNWYK